MKKTAYILALLLFAAACNTDKVSDMDFEIVLVNNPGEIYAGDEVTFTFTGDPDYIVFWSGEDGHKYANRDRTVLSSIDDMTLSYTMKQQYGRVQSDNVMDILISKDFTGPYTEEGIASATWIELSDGSSEEWAVPEKSSSSETLAGTGSLNDYKDGKFVLAFRYRTSERLDDYVQHPRVDVTLSLSRTSDGQRITTGNPQDDFGFRHVLAEGPSAKFTVDASTILFQPANDDGSPGIANPSETGFRYVEDWCISNLLDPGAIAPDKGEPVRSLSTPADSWTYSYSTPGIYTVSFSARNANAWNMKEIVRETVIEVKER